MLFKRFKEDFTVTDIDKDDKGSFFILGSGTISSDQIKQLEKRYAIYCLRIETVESYYVNESEYGEEDTDEGEKEINSTFYRWLRVKKNSAYLARYQGEVIGVVFYVKDGKDKKGYIFSFDGKIAQSFYTGFRGTYRSHLFGIKSLTLVPIEKGMEIKEICFERDAKAIGI